MTDNPSTEGMGRRIFLRRLLRTTALAVATGATGLVLWDRSGPRVAGKSSSQIVLPDYAVEGKSGLVAVAHGHNRHKTIAGAVAALGGMAAFVKPGDSVLIKVNAAFATPPILGATTHPDCVTVVVDLCKQAGAGRIIVTDNPINDPAACFDLTGIAPAAHAAGAQVVLPTADRFSAYTLPGGRLIDNWPVLTAPLLQADKVIGLAPIKDHHRSGASMTLKNWYGLLGGRRNIFHQQIHAIIAELAVMIRPTLVILDGTVSMIAKGPTGGSVADLKPTGTVIAGTDPVAVDGYGAKILGLSSESLPHLLMAQRVGAGRIDVETLNPIEINTDR